jgi:hypothetical protein
MATGISVARPLNFYDLGPEPFEDHGGYRTRKKPGQVENNEALQRLRGLLQRKRSFRVRHMIQKIYP